MESKGWTSREKPVGNVLTLSGFSNPNPYLLTAVAILFESLSICQNPNRSILITFYQACKEVPKGWEPNERPCRGKVEEERSLCVYTLRVVEISITGTVVQDLQPAFPMSCENGS